MRQSKKHEDSLWSPPCQYIPSFSTNNKLVADHRSLPLMASLLVVQREFKPCVFSCALHVRVDLLSKLTLQEPIVHVVKCRTANATVLLKYEHWRARLAGALFSTGSYLPPTTDDQKLKSGFQKPMRSAIFPADSFRRRSTPTRSSPQA
jgi:hypothetical protein